jgi:signal peptidase I
MARADFARLPAAAAPDTLDADRDFSADNIARISLNDADVGRYHLPAQRLVLAAGYLDFPIKQLYGQRWNQDNFGPVVVPANAYFVLGDSRHNAMDSRYIGAIPKEDFRGTILGKH